MSHLKQWVAAPIVNMAHKVCTVIKQHPKTIVATAIGITAAFMLKLILKNKNERLVQAINNNQPWRFMFLRLLNATLPENLHKTFTEELVQAIDNHNYKRAQTLLDFDFQIPESMVTHYTDEFFKALEHNDLERSLILAQTGITLESRRERASNMIIESLYRSHECYCAAEPRKNDRDALRMVRLLMTLGGTIAADNEHAIELFYLAAAHGNKTVTQYLINAGINVNARIPSGDTAMHAAAFQGYTGIVQSLLDGKANINEQNNLGQTPLSLAVMDNHPQTIGFLVRNGADVNRAAIDGTTPLMYAAMKGMTTCIQRLLVCPTINITIQNTQGMTAHDLAATQEIRALIQKLT